MTGVWLAALSGLIAAATLLLGAAIAWFVDIPQRAVAGILALGAGVLIATVAFELVDQAVSDGGVGPTAGGLLVGALLYIVADWLVSRPSQPATGAPANIVDRRSTARFASGTGAAIAIGALIDGIPESIVMGLAVLHGGGISIPIVVAVAISNFPEGLGSTAALKRGGSSARRVALLWCGIALITVVATLLGYLAFQPASDAFIAFVIAIAAGGLLAMICNTMIPEAFEKQRTLTGLWATLGFLAAFLLHEVAG
ncbi:ZIP family zinc transporter [Microbacterium sp. zg.B48]|uniref:ZIP family metal transporter n=1 Tax=Microbacterium sp. zg.B48 TaxID=2969408 RepID=UPI00214B4FE3|nr:ZIP family zinc transporter [Microbacterium sp. zg.B48]MCR2762834.1 ZIP family zinc transporter [Microbacterium sp. zg.B48]